MSTRTSLTTTIRSALNGMGYRKAIFNRSLNAATVIALVFISFPIYWMANSSIQPVDVMYSTPPTFLPRSFTLENINNIINNTRFPNYYVNTLILTAGVVSLQTVVSTLGGYGLTRIDFRYKRTFARSILFGYMFPPILLGIPMYIIFRQFGLINSYIGAILAITATGLPITLWIMWQFFQTVPISLEESAQMAGASRFRAFYEIALPLAKPGIMAVATLSFSHAWGAYTIPKILLVEEELWHLTIGVESFIDQTQVLWPEIMASITLALIPSFFFLYTLHKYWEVIAV